MNSPQQKWEVVLALAAAVLLAVACPGCGGHGSAGNLPTPVGAGLRPAQGRSETGPYVLASAELQTYLEQELSRLGKDPSSTASAAPQGEANAVFDLTADTIDPDGEGGDPPTGIALSWTEQLIGDYDQNGLVNGSDLTPLGANWQANVEYDDPSLHGGFAYWPTGDPDEGKSGSAAILAASSVGADLVSAQGRDKLGPYDRGMPPGRQRSQVDASGSFNWRLARIDGDRDGQLYTYDITPIAVHWRERLSGYLIERAVNRGSGVWEWDDAPLDLGHGTAPSAPRSLAYAPADAPDPLLPVRYHVTLPAADIEYAQLFRVTAYDADTQQAGPPSNLAAYYPAIDTTPPVWVDTVGVTKLIPGYEQLTVHFGEAEDAQSPPVSYRVFWAEGDPEYQDAPFDYESANSADVDSAPYTITGLTNDQYYRVAVRAMDSADPANMEMNTVVLGDTPTADDVYAPEWNGKPGIQDLFYGNGAAVVVWQAATDHYEDSEMTWESGPPIYRVYYGEGTEVDFTTAHVKEFDDLEQPYYIAPIIGLDTTQPHWFAVRARDQASPPNEDDNTVALQAAGIVIERFPFPEATSAIPVDSKLATWDIVTDHSMSQVKFTEVWCAPDLTFWLTSWRVESGGLVHDFDFELGTGKEDDRDYIPFVAELSDSGDLSLLFELASPPFKYEPRLFRQEDMAVTDVDIGDLAIESVRGFDLEMRPWAVLTDWIQLGLFVFEYRLYWSDLPPIEMLEFWYHAPSESTNKPTIVTGAVYLNNGYILHGIVGGGLDGYKILSYGGNSVEIVDPPDSGVEGVAFHGVYGSAVQQPVYRFDSIESSELSFFKQNDRTRAMPGNLAWKPAGYAYISVQSLDRMAMQAWFTTTNWYINPGTATDLSAYYVTKEEQVLKVPIYALAGEKNWSYYNFQLCGDGKVAFIGSHITGGDYSDRSVFLISY